MTRATQFFSFHRFLKQLPSWVVLPFPPLPRYLHQGVTHSRPLISSLFNPFLLNSYCWYLIYIISILCNMELIINWCRIKETDIKRDLKGIGLLINILDGSTYLSYNCKWAPENAHLNISENPICLMFVFLWVWHFDQALKNTDYNKARTKQWQQWAKSHKQKSLSKRNGT